MLHMYHTPAHLTHLPDTRTPRAHSHKVALIQNLQNSVIFLQNSVFTDFSNLFTKFCNRRVQAQGLERACEAQDGRLR